MQLVFDYQNTQPPVRKHTHDAGLDLYCPDDGIAIFPHKFMTVNTRVRVLIPDGYMGLVCPRSSLTVQGVICHVGVIDAGYTGEIRVTLENATDETRVFDDDDRIAQLVVAKCEIPQMVLGDVGAVQTERGEGGFGSTNA